jgi:hypothetical protein
VLARGQREVAGCHSEGCEYRIRQKM